MVAASTVAGVGAMVALVAASAFFSSSETAIFSLAADWAPAADVHGADALARLREDPHRLLVTILVGNNVVNVAVSSLATLLLVRYLSPEAAAAAATVVVSTVVLVFGEIVPKAYGLGHAEEWSLTVAGPLTAVGWAFSPLVAAFDGVTRRLAAAVGGNPEVEDPYEG
jgi:Mg2+/Co2+ transporter CorB